jgi:hypothetical protein
MFGVGAGCSVWLSTADARVVLMLLRPGDRRPDGASAGVDGRAQRLRAGDDEAAVDGSCRPVTPARTARR